LISKLRRCGSAGNQRRTEYLWREWQHSEHHGGAVRVCRRCGELTLPKQPQVATIIISAAAAQAPPASATHSSASDAERAQMLERLKPKMGQLGEMLNALGGVVERLHSQTREQIAAAGAEEASQAMRGCSSDTDSQRIERDARLIGHWRFTDAMSSSGGFSQATDYHRVLEADGDFVDRRHTCGSFGEGWSDPESGRWRTESRTLYLQYDGGSNNVFEYHLENDMLFFPRARHQRLWERVG
jgi:hypothetical protein